MNSLAFSSQEFGELRVFNEDNNISFAAVDVCRALDIKNNRDALSRLDDDEKGVALTDTLGGKQQISTINEYGLYNLVLSSRKSKAKQFKRWVTHEVLPSIRKDGAYVTVKQDETPEQLIARALVAAQSALERANKELEEAAPKAGYFDSVMSGNGLTKVQEVARQMHQYDKSITMTRLFNLLKADGFLTRDRQATKKAIDAGYLLNYQPATTYLDSKGQEQRPKPYGKFTDKGIKWAVKRYCKQVSINV